jgi:hypothetical protein
MKNSTALLFFFMLLSKGVAAQSVSTSPYSIYGLGSLYESNFGSITAMGSTGIALSSATFINNKNPASLSSIGPNSFFFDVGAKSIWSTYQNKSKKEKKNNFQFSHIALAFGINSKSGASVALKPYSSASYLISNYKIDIENSNESYFLDADSNGGLSNLDISYGYQISKKIALGIASSIYFGSIDDNKSFAIANSKTTINSTSSYKGIRFTLGNQYKVDSTFTVGLILKTPSKINADKKQSVTSTSGLDSSLVLDNIASDNTSYYLPLEIGFGVNKVFKNNLSLSFDYEKSFWNMTNQATFYGEYTNQDKLSVGCSYYTNKRKMHFYDKLHYFSGINYDSGFLLINNKRVNNFGITAGIGIPLERTKSLINISYSYGLKGKISNDLIKENYHTLGINLSMEAIWFVKRQYD